MTPLWKSVSGMPSSLSPKTHDIPRKIFGVKSTPLGSDNLNSDHRDGFVAIGLADAFHALFLRPDRGAAQCFFVSVEVRQSGECQDSASLECEGACFRW